ncbi:MAG: hypothetical protein ACR2RD_16270 [Woeseiaceae bacterium]
MSKSGRGLALWGIYGVFACYVVYTNWHPEILQFGGPLGMLKMAVWAALIGFLAYSVYCTSREDLFRTIGVIAKLYWGRQIGVDLYLGLLVAMLFIYLNEGAVVALIWLLPTLAFANLAILLYVAVNFETIAAKFLI